MRNAVRAFAAWLFTVPTEMPSSADLGLGQVLVVAQHHDGSLPGRQLREGGTQRMPVVRRYVAIRPGAVWQLRRGNFAAPASPPPR